MGAPLGTCGEYYSGNIGLLPTRIKEVNPDAIRDRWVNFVYSMDLTPEPDDDELGEPSGAWSIWDIPVNVAAQIDDARGDDLIVVAVADRVYSLDWTRFYDEFNWDVKTGIYRRLRTVSIPSVSSEIDQAEEGSYSVNLLRRFREFVFNLATSPTSPNTKYRVTVNETNTTNIRRGSRTTQQRNRMLISLSGADFNVLIEHQAYEQFDPVFWYARWDAKRKKMRENVSP